jgi:hypothetical protein
MSAQEEKKFCGNNVGNLFHRYCTYSLFKKENISFIYPEIQKDLLKEVKLIVISIANILDGKSEHEWLYHLLNDFEDIPILIFGLGCQKSLNQDDIIIPNKLKIFFTSFVDEKKSNYIFVRGNTTKQVFDDNNIVSDRIIVSGCQSILFNKKRDLGRRLLQKIQNINELEKIVYYTNEETPLYYDDIYKCMVNDYNKLYFEFKSGVRKDLFFDINIHNHFTFLKTENIDACITPKIHGCNTCLCMEIPVLLIVHDERLKELAETQKYPYVFYEDIKNIIINKKKIKELFQSLSFDFELFDENRIYLQNKYIYVLNKMGVKDEMLNLIE